MEMEKTEKWDEKFKSHITSFTATPDTEKHEYKVPKLRNLNETIEFCTLNTAKNYYLYRDKGEKLGTLEETLKLTILAIRYLVTDYALNYKKSVNLIQNNKGKNVGLVIQNVNDIQSQNIFDLATFSSNYRLRMLQDGQVFVFKKPYLGANFILDNSLII